jgi:hypothetical protein
MTDIRWDRWAAGSGIAFAVLAVAAFLFAYDLPTAGDSSTQIVSYFQDNDTAVLWQAFLFGLAAIAFLWFTGTIAASIRRAENDPAGRIPAIIVAAGATSAALYLAGIGALVTLAKSAGELEPATARVIYEASAAAFTLTDFTAIVFVAAISLGVVRTGLLAPWIAYAGAVAIVVGIVHAFGALLSDAEAFGPGGVIGIISFLVFLAWTLATSALLVQRIAAEVPTPRMAPTG